MVNLNLSMFRAYDIRTKSQYLTDALAERLGHAEAVYFRDTLGVPGVLLAHDARSTGPHYLEIIAASCLRAGLDVRLVPGVCSTSEFYFAAMKHPHLAAVMIGASHNPSDDTGQKILAPGVQPVARHIGPAGGLDRIQELYQAAEQVSGAAKGKVTAYDPTEDYLHYSMALAGVAPGSLKGLTLLQDYLNGAAGREMMLAFTRAGATLTPLHFTADGQFPLGDPNPVKAKVISDGLETLKIGDYRLGMFFDGDGDRIDFYRGDSAYLASSFVYAGILPEIRKRCNGNGMGVYADLKANPLAVMEMARSGLSVQVIRNGHSQIKNAMYENPSMLGTVEESAHFYEAFMMSGSRYCTENTLYIALLTARVWHTDPERFNRLFQLQAETAREREWGYLFPDDDKRAAALEAVRTYFTREGAVAINRMPNGMDLEATLMRRGLPFSIDENTVMAPDWLQVCQRISQSENGLARWEVLAATPKLAQEAKMVIGQLVKNFSAGDEYQG